MGKLNVPLQALILAALCWSIYEVRGMRDAIDREQARSEFTGLVFRFDGGTVELAQSKGQTLEDFVREYEQAVRRYLASEAK